ncbi:MAG TPA: hypothetical protein VIN77_11415 [Aurantimonas sp.]|uniref:Uncharacterized protein n=1 Tax=Aurantimonas marianensis TaxID=2920428 RepID=A0A9X2HDM3_9HYPH|nr:hypothetical protein [Aurantimonas marianensis]MCP3055669.1 hypothetical protein [Aurantimonas marianensis]
MGKFMGEDDIYIDKFFELINLRFAPSLGTMPDDFGGIDEMVALQREFQIFKKGRSLRDSAAIMNLGGFWNQRAKNRWYSLLDNLKNHKSNFRDLNGDEAIVTALIENLGSGAPYPVFFKAHDLRDGNNLVLIVEADTPLFYIETKYLTISLPMQPRRAGEGPATMAR